MLQGSDHLSLVIACLSFAIFLFVHVLFLRSSESFPANRAISLSLVLGLMMNVFLLYTKLVDEMGFGQLWLVIFFSAIVYVLLVLHYLVWVFGMGEAAIRIRLLRELERSETQSASLEEIKQNYNAEKILKSRLDRLVGAGHLAFDGKCYTLKSKILLIQIYVERIFKKLLGIPL